MDQASPTLPRDPVADSLKAFDRVLRARTRRLVTPALIEEHRAAPNGPHGRDLSAVLNYLRRAPVEGKLAIYAQEPFACYRIIRLSGRRGMPPVWVDSDSHASIEDASHAIFLLRIAALAAEADGDA